MVNTMQITTILWDVDGTLLDFEYSQRFAITKCFRSIGREITEDTINLYARINESFWKRLELGEITKEQLLPGRFTALFKELGMEAVDVEAFRREYQEALGSVFSYLDDSLKICSSLQGRFKQYVVTNGVASTQKNKLKLAGFDKVMDGMFISEEIGSPKPNTAFFNACFLGIEEKNKEHILLIGDSLSSDIRGGVQAGIRTCWYRPEGTANTSCWQPDAEISDLHQIYDIIRLNK